MRRPSVFLVAAYLLVVAAPATAAPNPQEWAAIQRDIGGLTVALPGQHHYGTDWERGQVSFNHRWLRLRSGGDAHWNAWRTGGVRRLHSVSLESWWTIARRIRVDASFRHEPQMNIALPAVGLTLQLLPGSATRSAVFVSARLPWMSTPEFETLAPTLGVEWSNEVIRSQASETHPPFVMYVGLRIDQGLRWTWFNDSAVPTQRARLMDTVLRGYFRWRYGPFSALLGFGGQQQHVFTLDSGLYWHFDRGGHAADQPPLRRRSAVSSSPSR